MHYFTLYIYPHTHTFIKYFNHNFHYISLKPVYDFHVTCLLYQHMHVLHGGYNPSVFVYNPYNFWSVWTDWRQKSIFSLEHPFQISLICWYLQTLNPPYSTLWTRTTIKTNFMPIKTWYKTAHMNASWEITWTDNLSWIIIHRIYSFSDLRAVGILRFLSGEIYGTLEQDLVKFRDTGINIYIYYFFGLIVTFIQSLNGKKLQHNVSTATATHTNTLLLTLFQY